jgi:hypothetical protein
VCGTTKREDDLVGTGVPVRDGVRDRGVKDMFRCSSWSNLSPSQSLDKARDICVCLPETVTMYYKYVMLLRLSTTQRGALFHTLTIRKLSGIASVFELTVN